jgi:hypothetical protein
MLNIKMLTPERKDSLKNELKNNNSASSLESYDSTDISINTSDDEKKLPVFTNEVIIIRP